MCVSNWLCSPIDFQPYTLIRSYANYLRLGLMTFFWALKKTYKQNIPNSASNISNRFKVWPEQQINYIPVYFFSRWGQFLISFFAKCWNKSNFICIRVLLRLRFSFSCQEGITISWYPTIATTLIIEEKSSFYCPYWLNRKKTSTANYCKLSPLKPSAISIHVYLYMSAMLLEIANWDTCNMQLQV